RGLQAGRLLEGGEGVDGLGELGFEFERLAVVGAGVVGATGFLGGEAEAVVCAGVGGLAGRGSDFEAAAQVGVGFVEGDTGVGGGAGNGVEGEVVPGVFGEDFAAEGEGVGGVVFLGVEGGEQEFAAEGIKVGDG